MCRAAQGERRILLLSGNQRLRPLRCPDIFACYLGRFIGIECKAGANKPTALQEAEMRKIEAAGGYTLVIREDTVFLLLDVLEKVRGARGIDSWVALDTHATLVSVRPKRTLK